MNKRKRNGISRRGRVALFSVLLLSSVGVIWMLGQVGAVSPDTKPPLQVGYKSDEQMIYVNLLTGGQTRLSSNPIQPDSFKLPSPDGKWSVYWEKQRSELWGDMWTLILEDVAAASSQRLTYYGLSDPVISWSPDSQRFVYAAKIYAGDTDKTELFIMNVATGETPRLTNNRSAENSPVFSPDGLNLAFTSDQDGSSRLYVMNLLSQETRLVTSETFAFLPSWSPDGRYIAFMSTHQDEHGDIYIIQPDGTGLQRISQTAAWDSNPVWLPYACLPEYCYTLYRAVEP